MRTDAGDIGAQALGPAGKRVLADALLEKFGGDSVGETRRNVRTYLENLRYR